MNIAAPNKRDLNPLAVDLAKLSSATGDGCIDATNAQSHRRVACQRQ